MQDIDETLKIFNKDLINIFGSKYVDLLIWGSVVLNDFTPHKGDIDFVVLLDGNTTDEEFYKVCELHDRYRARESNYLEYQLEGTYYPKEVLQNINSQFDGIYIGTGRKGWKVIHNVKHNSFDLIQLKEIARSYRNVKTEIHLPTCAEILSTVQKDYEMWNKYIDDIDLPAHEIIHWAARVVYYYIHKKIGSKSKACYELYENHIKDTFVNYCSKIRSPYDKDEINKLYPKSKMSSRLCLDYVKKNVIDRIKDGNLTKL